MADVFDGVRIVGAGQAIYEKKSHKTVQRLMYEAGTAALDTAGLPWSAVDGLAVTCFQLPPDNAPTVAEHIGIEARFLFQGLYGGASGIIGMAHAARAIRDGACDVAVVVAADAFDVAAHNETLDRFNGSIKEYMSPQGFGGANGIRRNPGVRAVTATIEIIQKPQPRINHLNRPFWDGCNEGRLMVQHCSACCRFVFYPRVCCPYCQHGELQWKEASGRGVIISHTTIRRTHHDGFNGEVPYVFAAVTLTEGPCVYAQIDGNGSGAGVARGANSVSIAAGRNCTKNVAANPNL